jgi:hypothetical protein
MLEISRRERMPEMSMPYSVPRNVRSQSVSPAGDDPGAVVGREQAENGVRAGKVGAEVDPLRLQLVERTPQSPPRAHACTRRTPVRCPDFDPSVRAFY